MTNTSIQQYSTSKTHKLLPSLTICPLPAYKKKGFFYNNSIFMMNTYNLEDLLVPSSLHELSESTKYTVKTIHSIILGRCYMITL